MSFSNLAAKDIKTFLPFKWYEYMMCVCKSLDEDLREGLDKCMKKEETNMSGSSLYFSLH